MSGVAQRTASNWVILYADEHKKTWTYLRKKMVTHFSNMQSSRSFIVAMFGIRQRSDNFDNLGKFNADVMDAFKVVQEILPLPDAPPPPPGNYTTEQCHASLQLGHVLHIGGDINFIELHGYSFKQISRTNQVLLILRASSKPSILIFLCSAVVAASEMAGVKLTLCLSVGKFSCNLLKSCQQFEVVPVGYLARPLS